MSVSRIDPEADAPSALWWLLMGLGLLCVAAGVLVLAKPGDSLPTLAVIVGVFMLVDGCFELAMSLSRRTETRGMVALLGVLNAVIGILLIRHPVGGVTAIALLTGIWLVAFGVVRFVASFDASEHRVWHFGVAIVEVGAGVIILSDAHIAYATLALLIGLSFIARGAVLFAFGWALHAIRHGEEVPPQPHVGATA